MSYSNGSGGTLTLPSPTHVHHVDVGSAVRSLRRSLSRSPSKFRLAGSGHDSAPGSGPASPSPEAAAAFQTPAHPSSGRFEPAQAASAPPRVSTIFDSHPFLNPQPSLSTPFKPSVKLSVRSARSKPASARPLSRTRVSPKSPLKRVFGPSPDSGNPIPPSFTPPEPQGEEKIPTFSEFALALSPVSRRNLERPSRHSMHLDVSGSSKHGLSKFMDANTDTFASISVSPLKRSDATSLDQTNPGSPVAKRRSLHGITSLSTDFNIFDFHPIPPQQGFDIHEDGNHEYQLTGSLASPFRDPVVRDSPTTMAMPPAPTMPKRTSSLRRSTLQQRHGSEGRTSWGRRAGEKQLAQLVNEATTPTARSRPRLSLDQYVPPDDRGSPFSPQAPLQNASIHPMPRQTTQPHPLSRTLTQSSSNSSVPDESPTHIPVHFGERARVPMNFSKSLPPGSHRPVSDTDPVATPQYKRAKPFQAAFMSTGLVSKMNRNPELGPPKHPGARVSAMPDTPCKKQYSSATYPPQFGSGRRQSRPSFGSPSTPFSSLQSANRGNIFGSQDKPGLFFGQNRSSHSRKVSLLSLDGDDHGESAAASDDFPPTPTKGVLFKSIGTPAQAARTPNVARSFTPRQSPFGLASEQHAASPGCKFTSLPDLSSNGGKSQGIHQFGAKARPSTPVLGMSPDSRTTYTVTTMIPVYNVNPRGEVEDMKTIPLLTVLNNPTTGALANADPTAPASPLNAADYSDNSSPRTPQDSMAPPDPSRLSISGLQDDKTNHSRPPATPTTSARHMFPAFPDRRLSVTPRNGHGPKDVDESLVARFDKSEVIGKGEFSKVFRVVKSSLPKSLTATFAATPSRRTPSTPDSGKMYAVKKLRIPFNGNRERESKLREVAILKALSNSDKVVHYMDSWEQNGHLYIQTEYCAEGGLDAFLKSVGQAGRLDDFRIWKILLEVTQGLAAIHAAGFIHLDLKPANIFIAFDGYLKIGDFGMATQWPAEKGIEGEGDREYIAPEILLGQFDKPADIFALGLIILEMACNVFLPDNGPSWQALRSCDLSIVPSLTSSEASAVVRDANGFPIEHESGSSNIHEHETLGSFTALGAKGKRRGFPFEAMTHDPSNLFGAQKRNELQNPPGFMTNANDMDSLDNIVKWILQPVPAHRPTADQLLASQGISWVASRRAAGATVYEGNWGPQAGPSVEELVDTEMTDV
ncbi:hypothetical protein B0H67DRAFT_600112 [Lasiosphaeris hirsuta]|uniref:Protein kinase domain-containing protein n=1 Tax=Lasiosphaeris hirsuta TaxID=260670 RepID=A0AA40ARM1_9PEZI|nr:hypothetical protein B0H67DRAFT_600112 [Lasiosphaeris hirsuta]